MGSAGSTGASSDLPEGMRDVPGAPGVYTGGGTPGTGSTGGGIADRAGSVRDTATEKLGQAREVAGEKLGQAREAAASGLSTAREKAGDLRATLADKLEAGAERLRGGVSGTSGAAYASAGSISIEADGGSSQLTNRLAGGLQGTADFLRDADMQNLKAGVERQVRENPARTLLIAVGLGYLIGKAFRK
jgi:ElaB/YqjD/DUF883 family membrane-anchored ribosome-binding protein